jgi:hypothetical protein
LLALFFEILRRNLERTNSALVRGLRFQSMNPAARRMRQTLEDVEGFDALVALHREQGAPLRVVVPVRVRVAHELAQQARGGLAIDLEDLGARREPRIAGEIACHNHLRPDPAKVHRQSRAAAGQRRGDRAFLVVEVGVGVSAADRCKESREL